MQIIKPLSEPKSSEPFLFFPETLNLFQNNRVNSLSLLFCHSSSNAVSITVCFFAYLHSLPIHFLILLFPVICFEIPITRIFFSISLEGSSYREISALYPDVSLSMKMCAQRKAGRSLYSSSGPLRLIISRSPLPCEKRSAWGGGWGVMISTETGKILVIFPERALRPSPQNL